MRSCKNGYADDPKDQPKGGYFYFGPDTSQMGGGADTVFSGGDNWSHSYQQKDEKFGPFLPDSGPAIVGTSDYDGSGLGLRSPLNNSGGDNVLSRGQSGMPPPGAAAFIQPPPPRLQPNYIGGSAQTAAPFVQPPTLLPGSTNTLVEPRQTVYTPASRAVKTWTKVPQSWYDLPMKEPADIRDLIANANLAGIPGSYVDSTNFATTGGPAWNASPLSLTGLPECFTLGTDNQLLVALAKQWNFKHLTANLNATLSPLLSNVIYLKAGTNWLMSIPLTTSTTITDVQLSFRNNAASVGDFIGGGTGAIPAISFTGTFNAAIPLQITLKKAGHAHLALRTIDYTGKYSMFGLECIIVN